MQFHKVTATLKLAASVVLFAALAIPANATPFSSALVAAVDPFTSGAGNCGSSPFDCFSTSSGSATVTQTYSQSGPGFTNDAFAQASLASATLKARAATSVSDPAFSPYSQSNATFSDGFTTRTTGGQPFVWNNTSAAFNLVFGGNNLLNSSGSDNAIAFAILAINTYGSTDATTNWISGPNTIQYFVYEFGAAPVTIFYTYNHVSTQLNTTQFYSTVPTSINASFTPNGDFDWVLILGASGQQSGLGSFDYDLAHTLTVDYVAPQGTVTTSDSGVFGTAPENIPEPLTLSVFAAGLAGVAGLRRRRSGKA